MVWKISAFYDGLARIAVPLFIFVSGAIYLNENKKVTYKKILLTILRFIVIFFIWDIFYHVFDLFVREKQALNLSTLKTLFFSLIQYKYHLWYLLAYIALLALTPVLKLICKRENRSQVRYLLIIFVAGTCLFEAFAYLVNAVNATSALYNVFKYLVNVTALANFGKFFSLIILYLSGWYFSTFDFSKYKKAIYWCFGIGTLLLPIVGIFICVLLNNHNLIAFIENYYYFPCYFLTVTTFLAFRYSKIANTPNKFVDYLCKQTFGIYLIHVLFVDYVTFLASPPPYSTRAGCYLYTLQVL